MCSKCTIQIHIINFPPFLTLFDIFHTFNDFFEGNDTEILNEATHFTSMLCPIRSPALIYHDNYYHGEKLDNASILSAVVYCLASNNQNDTSTIKSVNEYLVDSKLALMVRDDFDKSGFSK